MKEYNVIGLMSGSSLDGMDVAYTRFSFDTDRPIPGKVDWQIVHADTLEYPDDWIKRLKKTPSMTAKDLYHTDAALGHWIGRQVKQFINRHRLQADFIASHGHTVFHFPEDGYTTQIGNGNAIAYETGLPVLYDVRSMDVAAGGQGAPFAPVADDWLLSGYHFYLNLGGIVNISARTKDGFVGYDIIGLNQLFNRLSHEVGLAYDEGGQIARQGKVIDELYQQLNQIAFFEKPFPKSLDNDWVVQNMIMPVMEYDGDIPDKMRTVLELASDHIIRNTKLLMKKYDISNPKLLLTGGGAHNTFLIERLRTMESWQWVVPEATIINYKEAALISLLGVLNKENVPNSSPFVTGASRNTVGGVWAGING